MKDVITNYLKATKLEKHLKEKLLLDGNVITADIFTSEKKLRKYARYVLIRRVSLKSTQKIINKIHLSVSDIFIPIPIFILPIDIFSQCDIM